MFVCYATSPRRFASRAPNCQVHLRTHEEVVALLCFNSIRHRCSDKTSRKQLVPLLNFQSSCGSGDMLVVPLFRGGV